MFRWTLSDGDNELREGQDGNAHARLGLLLVETNEYSSQMLLELVVLENDPEREDVEEEVGEAPGQPIDIGELDAFGEDIVVSAEFGTDVFRTSGVIFRWTRVYKCSC